MSSLVEDLTNVLPLGYQFTIYHISTPPTRCDPIYSPAPGSKLDRTYVESHSLAISILSNTSGSGQVFILAIECLIYSTRHLTTIFVSKADSTGFLSLLELPKGSESPLRTITSTFISFLVASRLRPGIKLVVDLFARASDQYLFPGSVENDSKHVSDDRQLIRWWCRVLSPLLQSYAAKPPPVPLFASPKPPASTLPTQSSQPTEAATAHQTTAQAYLLVPGADSITTFLPTYIRTRWTHAHPLRHIAARPNLPPRCLIPHFPDDPKGRFVDELDAEIPDAVSSSISSSGDGALLPDTRREAGDDVGGARSPSKRGNGLWRSVRTLEGFWEMMAFRSECSSGRLVGFLWVVVEQQQQQDKVGRGLASQAAEEVFALRAREQSASLIEDGERGLDVGLQDGASLAGGASSSRRSRQQRSGPIVSRVPRIKQSKTSSLPVETKYYVWPEDSRGMLVLDKRQYDKAHKILLDLDFAGVNVASRSTRQWIEQVAVIGRQGSGWGVTVTGTKKLEEKKSAEADGNNGSVNVLLGVKRKARQPENRNLADEPVVNVLSAGIIKKKPKRVQPVTMSD